MLPSTLQDTTNIKPQLFSSVPDWEIKKKTKPHILRSQSAYVGHPTRASMQLASHRFNN